MTYRAIIIDDERLARTEMRRLLVEFGEVDVVGDAESLSAAEELIQAQKPELVFLDIQLSGESGFDLLQRVERNFKLIFVTAFDAYAVRAFEVNAIDYLLKPVNPERLAKAIARLGEEPVFKALHPLEFDDRIFLDLGARSQFLKVSAISHIIAAGDYTDVSTNDGQKLLVEKPLREWEERLPEKHFLRIHRQAIVNLEEVEHLEPLVQPKLSSSYEGSGTELAVSRRYAVKLKSKFS